MISLVAGPKCSSSWDLSMLYRNYRRDRRSANNIGIKKRLRIFTEENPDMDLLKIDEQTMDLMESELTNERSIVDYQQKSIESMKKKIDFKMIERKYFKHVKLPNFLTWAEKEQIRQLHSSEPNLWTFEKLSQCFPASPDIIKKIVSSNWKFESKERVLKHDKQVSKNWELLRKGEITLDPSLKQHLSTFSSREHLQNANDMDFVNVKTSLPVNGSEFAKIIIDYKENQLKIKGKDESIVNNNSHAISNSYISSETESENNSKELTVINSPERNSNSKMITLDSLRRDVSEKLKFKEMSEYDKAFLDGGKEQSQVITEVLEYENIPVKTLNKIMKVQAPSFKMEEDEVEEKIPMRVKTPKNMPKGSVYRVQDIYYDTDGRFLYRVPGMK